MEKLVYLVWERPSIDPAALRARFLDDVAPRLLALQPHALQMDLDDEHAQMQSMVPGARRRAARCARASRSGSTRTTTARRTKRSSARPASASPATSSPSRCIASTATTRTPRSATGPTAPARPGIITLTIFDKPAGVDDETFYGHWYGHQSPMSEDMQPRARYVRNAVVRSVTPGAPRYRAIVEESWPSVEHVTNLHTFFGASSNEELGENIRVMLDSTKLLYDPATMRNYPLSEYILKS